MSLASLFKTLKDSVSAVLSFGKIIKEFLLSVVCIVPVELAPVITVLATIVLILTVVKFVNLVIPFM